ncbi:MAG: hypothetical protein ACF8MF_11720 [Phycisphaerales bacterium JB052]
MRFYILVCLALLCVSCLEMYGQDGAECVNAARLGTYEYQPNQVQSFQVQSGIMFVRESGRLVLVDVRDPAGAEVIDATDIVFPGGIDNIVPFEHAVLVIAGSRVYYISMSDTHELGVPEVVYEFSRSPHERSVYQNGYLFFVVQGDIEVLDIRDMLNPQLVETFQSDQVFSSLIGDGGFLASRYTSKTVIYDVTDPLDPQQSKEIETPAGDDILDMAYVGGVLHFLTQSRLFGLDPSDDFSFMYELVIPGGFFTTQLLAHGTKLYVPVGDYGVLIYETSGQDTPVLVGSYGMPKRTHQVDVDQGIMYSEAGQDLLVFDDVSVPARVLIGSQLTPSGRSIHGIVSHNGYVCVTTGYGGLLLYAPNELGVLELVSQTDIPGASWDMATDGSMLYVESEFGSLQGVYAVEISDPHTPVVRGFWEFSPDIRSMAAHDGWLVVASGGSGAGTYFVNFQDPDAPFQVTWRPSSSSVNDVEIYWPYVIVANNSSGMRVYDWGGRGVAREHSWIFSDGVVGQCEVVGDRLYFNSGSDLVLVDLAHLTTNQDLIEVDRVHHAETIFDIYAVAGAVATNSHSGDFFARPALNVYELDSISETLVSRGCYQTEASIGPLLLQGDMLCAPSYHRLLALDFSACVDCPSDLNNDGDLNFFDVSAFLVGYLGSDSVADWNDDGAWNFFDVSGFLVSLSEGCP